MAYQLEPMKYDQAQELIKQHDGKVVNQTKLDGQIISTVWDFNDGSMWIEEEIVPGYNDQYRMVKIHEAEGSVE